VRAFDAAHAGPRPRGQAAVAAPGLGEPLTGCELEVLRLLAVGRPTGTSPRSWWSPSTPSRSTSATSSTSSGRPTAPRPSPGHASSACSA